MYDSIWLLTRNRESRSGWGEFDLRVCGLELTVIAVLLLAWQCASVSIDIDVDERSHADIE